MTNADIIRDMTDEKLASWFFNHDYCPYCEAYYGNKDRELDCRAVLLEWLRQEAKDDG